MRQHISTQFTAELEAVVQQVLAMGRTVEGQIREAMMALLGLDAALAAEVAERDRRVNQAEVQIDEECSHILVRRQPTAGDLRLVYAIIKTITDLERIGDEAQKIAHVAQDLARRQPGGGRAPVRGLEHLAALVLGMVSGALAAFAGTDAEGALAVVRQDSEVDREYEALMRQCVTFMMEDPRTIHGVMAIIWCARALERVGDHSRNIAEYVIYLVKGKDVRHLPVETIEKEIRD